MMADGKPDPKEFASIQEVVIMEGSKKVRWEVVRTEENGEFVNHLPGPNLPNYHAKTLTVHIRRECDGND